MYKFLSDKHVHTFKGEPLYGTTTVLNIISKELTWWSSGLAVAEFGWINPKNNTPEDCKKAARTALEMINGRFIAETISGEHEYDVDDYLKFLNSAYRAHLDFKNKRAVEGTDLHAEIEKWIKLQITGESKELFKPEFPESINPFIFWSKNNVKRFLFSEIYCYSEKLWVGGIVDFAYEDMQGNYVLADIKSSKDVYFSHFVQLGGYDIQLSENGGLDDNGKKVWEYEKPFARHEVFALGKPHWNKSDICQNPVGMKEAFKNAFELYKMKEAFEEFKSGRS